MKNKVVMAMVSGGSYVFGSVGVMGFVLFVVAAFCFVLYSFILKLRKEAIRCGEYRTNERVIFCSEAVALSVALIACCTLLVGMYM